MDDGDNDIQFSSGVLIVWFIRLRLVVAAAASACPSPNGRMEGSKDPKRAATDEGKDFPATWKTEV
jgi:hypothetical protein